VLESARTLSLPVRLDPDGIKAEYLVERRTNHI